MNTTEQTVCCNSNMLFNIHSDVLEVRRLTQDLVALMDAKYGCFGICSAGFYTFY